MVILHLGNQVDMPEVTRHHNQCQCPQTSLLLVEPDICHTMAKISGGHPGQTPAVFSNIMNVKVCLCLSYYLIPRNIKSLANYLFAKKSVELEFLLPN